MWGVLRLQLLGFTKKARLLVLRPQRIRFLHNGQSDPQSCAPDTEGRGPGTSIVSSACPAAHTRNLLQICVFTDQDDRRTAAACAGGAAAETAPSALYVGFAFLWLRFGLSWTLPFGGLVWIGDHWPGIAPSMKHPCPSPLLAKLA